MRDRLAELQAIVTTADHEDINLHEEGVKEEDQWRATFLEELQTTVAGRFEDMSGIQDRLRQTMGMLRIEFRKVHRGVLEEAIRDDLRLITEGLREIRGNIDRLEAKYAMTKLGQPTDPIVRVQLNAARRKMCNFIQPCRDMEDQFSECLKGLREREDSILLQVQGIRMNEALADLSELKDRAMTLHHLEMGLQSLFDLFKDMALFLVEHGEILDRIEVNTQEAKEEAVIATRTLREAQRVKDSTRQRQVCIAGCLLCIVVILVFVLLSVLSSVFS
jgi:t-SNARE complex subunit (syntaxin)